MCAASDAYRGVRRANNILVQLDEAPWPFATQNSGKISAFWQEKQKRHPHFLTGGSRHDFLGKLVALKPAQLRRREALAPSSRAFYVRKSATLFESIALANWLVFQFKHMSKQLSRTFCLLVEGAASAVRGAPSAADRLTSSIGAFLVAS
jgi:hypothetical protein